ncbi:MAG: hypothetical protein ACPGUV_02650 [Polyangiales bacterium]
MTPLPAVGARLQVLPSAADGSQMAFAELDLHPRWPSDALAQRWRKQAPDPLRPALVLPLGTLTASTADKDGLRRDLTPCLHAARALWAPWLVLHSGTSLTPGVQGRRRLEAVVRILQERRQLQLVWQAGGVWENEAAADFAAELGVLPALDPLDREYKAPTGTHAYFRLRALGARPRLGLDALHDVAERLQALPPQMHWALSIDSRHAEAEARSLLGMLSNVLSG